LRVEARPGKGNQPEPNPDHQRSVTRFGICCIINNPRERVCGLFNTKNGENSHLDGRNILKKRRGKIWSVLKFPASFCRSY